MMQSINGNGEDCLALISALQYGNLEALFEVAAANILTVDSEPALNTVVLLPEVIAEPIYALPIVYKASVNNLIEAWEDQVPIDIAMQEAGTIESVFEFLLLNGIGLTDNLSIGALYKKPAVVKKTVIAAYNNIRRPASGYSVLPGKLLSEGIDYWAIENDFIVS